jgi:hypothetical protein
MVLLQNYTIRIKSNLQKDFEKERKNLTLYSVILFLVLSFCFWKKYFDSISVLPLYDNFRMIWFLWAIVSTIGFLGMLGFLIYDKVIKFQENKN